MANTTALQGKCDQVRKMLKQRWNELTDEDLRFASGNVDQLIARIHHRTGEARDAIEQFLASVTDSGASAMSGAVKNVGQYAREASDQFRDGYGRFTDEVGRQFDRSQELIREKPAHSIATAFAVGILFGAVIGLVLRSRS
jgi:uncharacterized protein YjbJ (UPF0337 family)